MKQIITILVFISCSLVLKSQHDSVMISCNFRNVELSHAIQDIEAGYAVKFFYRTEWTDSLKISVVAENISLDDNIMRGKRLSLCTASH